MIKIGDKKIKLLMFLFTLFILSSANGASIVRVALFAVSGIDQSYERDGVFWDSAFYYEGQWWVASFQKNHVIQLSDSDFRNLYLNNPRYSRGAIVLQSPSMIEIAPQALRALNTQRFSLFAEWNDRNSTYCSKMVGQALGLNPLPIRYDGGIWKRVTDPDILQQVARNTGHPGLSPDGLFAQLRQRGYALIYASDRIDPAVTEIIRQRMIRSSPLR